MDAYCCAHRSHVRSRTSYTDRIHVRHVPLQLFLYYFLAVHFHYLTPLLLSHAWFVGIDGLYTYVVDIFRSGATVLGREC
ncbi:hypothetical protein BDV29DRAFT_184550, partial [Aspergillus leporis]